MAKDTKEPNTGSGHLDALVNASTRVKAWRTVSIFLGVIIFALSYALILAVRSMPVRLVPYEFATYNGVYKIEPNGAANAEYMAYIAESDIKLFTDWTPQTIGQQYFRFLNRCAPELYAAKNVELISEAQQVNSSSYSQVFYPSERKYLGPGRIQVSGQLTRYVGERIVLQVAAVYTVSYRFFNGLPSMTDIVYTTKQEAERMAAEAAKQQIQGKD